MTRWGLDNEPLERTSPLGGHPMTFDELLEVGWTPPADEFHDDLRAPERGEPRERIEGTYDRGHRTAGYERSRGTWR